MSSIFEQISTSSHLREICGVTQSPTSTYKIPGSLEPQSLFATTEIFPLIASSFVVIKIDVDVELPFHPIGNTHVYDDAPVTGCIL